jgi:small subunit ribosomal protein S17
MAEEEKQEATKEENGEEQAPEASEAPEAEAPAEEAPAEEEEEAPAEEEEAPAEEPEAELSPKELRKRERSRASGPARPQRTPEERAAERAERQRGASVRRRRYRAARRAKRGEPGTGTPEAPHEPGPRKVRQGTVVSAGADKTITVRIAVVRRHPTYEKVVRRSGKLRAHDEQNQAKEGDIVRVVESRPLSRTKRWRLLEVIEKAR